MLGTAGWLRLAGRLIPGISAAIPGAKAR